MGKKDKEFRGTFGYWLEEERLRKQRDEEALRLHRQRGARNQRRYQREQRRGGKGSPKGTTDAVIGFLSLATATLLVSGAGEARATTPTRIQPTGGPDSAHHLIIETTVQPGQLVDMRPGVPQSPRASIRRGR